MRKPFFKHMAAFVLSAVSALSTAAPIVGKAEERKLPSGTGYDEIGSVIESFYQENEKTAAGLAAAVFTADETIYEGYFGYEDHKKTNPIDKDSVIEWGSISKTTVWVSVMQLAEQGKIDLDADVRTYLPDGFFKNLKYDDKITMLNLMNHNAGFEESVIGMAALKKDDIVTLEDYINRFQPEQIFRPGEVVSYSNWGATLAAYIVERISGQQYYEYAQEHIFKPLGMENTAINADLSDAPAVDAKRDELQSFLPNGKKSPLTRSYIVMYPVGMCTSTLEDFISYGQALLSYDERIMSHESFEELYSPSITYTGTDIPRFCHGFMTYVTDNDARVVGHGGNTGNCSSMLYIDLKNGVGNIVMTNQYGETTFNNGIPEKVFGECKSSSTDYKGFISNPRSVYNGVYKIVRGLQGWGIITKGLPEGMFFNETDDKLELSVVDYIKTEPAEILPMIVLLALWLLGILVSVICLIVKIIKLIAKKKSRNPIAVWRAIACAITLVSLGPVLTLVNFVSTFDLMNLKGMRSNSFVLAVLAAAYAIIAVIGLIKLIRSDAEKKCVIRNLSAMFFDVIITANIIYWQLYMFWKI